VAAFDRIAWPLSLGIGGRFPSESVAALTRIPQEPREIAIVQPDFLAASAAQDRHSL
jgi:hypothetical protein